MHKSTGSLEATDRASAAVQKTVNRVTLQAMLEKIDSTDYLLHGITTICIVTMKNGYKVIAHTTPADPDNFDAELGRTHAREAAIRLIWPLEGYLLREKLGG